MIPPSEPSLEELDVLPEVADQFQGAFGLDTPPATLAEWVDATSPLVQTATFQERFDHRFRTSSSRHQISAPERNYYIGLFDTLLVPFIRGDVREFTIRSESPVSERVMDVQVDAGEPSIAPDDAVMSFGVATDVVSAEYFEVPAHIAYARFNKYTNAFGGIPAYERWARNIPDIETMRIPLSVGVVLAKRLMTR